MTSRRVSEVTAGPVGTPFDTAAAPGAKTTFRSSDDEAWDRVSTVVGRMFGRGRGAMPDDKFADFVNWPREKQVKYVLRAGALPPTDDAYVEAAEELLPTHIRMRKGAGSRQSARRQVEGVGTRALRRLIREVLDERGIVNAAEQWAWENGLDYDRMKTVSVSPTQGGSLVTLDVGDRGTVDLLVKPDMSVERHDPAGSVVDAR